MTEVREKVVKKKKREDEEKERGKEFFGLVLVKRLVDSTLIRLQNGFLALSSRLCLPFPR
jgi:hypothetical protein